MTTAINMYTAKKIARDYKSGDINFSIAIQRSLKWKEEQKTELIYSILMGYPTGIVYLWKNGDILYGLDGKQRTNAISEFLEGDLPLPEDFPLITQKDEEFDFSGCVFNDLPDWAKEIICDYNITVCVISDATEGDINNIFYLINNGTALSTIEKIRVKAPSFDAFKEISKKDIINEITTEKGKLSYADELLAQQCYAIKYMPDVSFETKLFKPYIMNIVVDSDKVEAVSKGLDWVYKAYKTLDISAKKDKQLISKIKGKIHFVSIFYLATVMQDKNKNFEDFLFAVKKFFITEKKIPSNSSIYNTTCGGHTAANSNISKRKNIMEELSETTFE